MAKADIKGAKTTDFIQPEEDRPAHGPLYAVNATSSRIVFSAKRDMPAFSFGPYPASDSIHQIPIEMLDTVEFMRLWAAGKILVSKSPNVAIAHGVLEKERAAVQAKKVAEVRDSIEEKGASKTFEVKTGGQGLPEVVEASKEKDKKTSSK